MREELKKKALLGVVGVLSLGAGSYWFFGRESGSGAASFDTGRVQRRAAAAPAEPTLRRNPSSPDIRPDSKPITRPQRQEPTIDPVQRKPKQRDDRIEPRKKPVRAS